MTNKVQAQLTPGTWGWWKARVDDYLERKAGVRSVNIPAFDYRQAFDQGMPPSVAANKALRAAGRF